MIAAARRRGIAVPVAVAALAVTAVLGAAPSARGVAVAGSVQQAFRPGTAANAVSATATEYTGPMLTLQAAKVGMTAAEPTLGVTRSGTAFFAASKLMIDTPQFWGIAQTTTLRSTDGGLTWQNVQLRIPVADVSLPPANLDPFVWVDQATGRVFNIDLRGDCSWLNFSDDEGESWTPNPLACGNFANDHQTIGAGKPRTLTTDGYENVVYYCVNQLINAGCGRSLDGGLTWEETEADPYPNGSSSCGYIHGHIETDAEGRVFLPMGCDRPTIAISEDEGKTWRRRVVSSLGSEMAHTSVAADSAGNLYYVFASRVTVAGRQRVRPFVAISRDHGQTWGDPMMIAPPGVNFVNFPVIAAGDEGRIAINFPGTTYTLSAGTKAVWNQYVVVSDSILTDDPILLSATANDPADPIHRDACEDRGGAGCGGLWDFQDVIVSPQGEAWASAADDCIGPCVTGERRQEHVGDGIAIRQIGGPSLRAPAGG